MHIISLDIFTYDDRNSPGFRILLYRGIFFYSSKIDLNYFDNLSETILLTSIVTLQDDNLLIPRENDPEKWKEKILWKTRFEKERKALLPSTAKRFYSLNFSNYVLTYSIETEESMQDSFSPRVRPVPLSLPFQCPPRLGGGDGSSCLSHEERRFSKSPSVLTITRVSSYPRCETRQGSKIPLGDYFSLATLLPSRLSPLSLSLPPPTRTRTNITGLKYVS